MSERCHGSRFSHSRKDTKMGEAKAGRGTNNFLRATGAITYFGGVGARPGWNVGTGLNSDESRSQNPSSKGTRCSRPNRIAEPACSPCPRLDHQDFIEVYQKPLVQAARVVSAQ